MSNKLYLPYEEAKPLINEADVLLFRGNSFYSKFLRISSDSPYTHVGIASFHNGHEKKDAVLECVEFHEKYGSRASNLETYNRIDKREIDVYRPVPHRIVIDYDAETKQTVERVIELNAKAITHDFREATGLPYGWYRIWRIALHKMAVSRIFYDPSSTADDTPIKDMIYPVCSTALAHFFSKHEYDLVTNKSDEWTEPGYIAMSPLLQYLFTIRKF